MFFTEREIVKIVLDTFPITYKGNYHFTSVWNTLLYNKTTR